MVRSFQDFQPDFIYQQGETQDIIELKLKDFRRDQLRVTFGTNGTLTICGERPVEGTRWIRFRKEFTPPKDCKANEIRARLSSGILYVTIPKKVVQQVPQQDQARPVQQASAIQNEGKLKQESSRSTEAAETFTTKESGPEDVTTPTENATLPRASPKSFISGLKMGRKTAMKVAASVTMLSLLFIVLFFMFKYYAPMVNIVN
ncbi:inactive protein RESTRICTED TEV MOVEMENT 2-like [Herrania umbratica]|uniref:Inactive protein RESTRICTED TEV MOVEMENT 2-like n=1 Tax=Herrania umbratica TaxID=108875 RepID=A0A6J1A6P6_9ROSI|nr:inactive protein RESTRICTED TEV MOVEMENT 2-like [Herrania umbratica]